jgi:ATP-dependent DNA helicase RecG
LRRLREARPAPVVPFDENATKSFTATLPFKLTDDQKVASMQVIKDLGSGRQMHRLLDGDVGSGKTLVAAIAMLNAARAGFQCALMAPTEILASQHYATLSRLLAGQSVGVALWTNSFKRSSHGQSEVVAGNKREATLLSDTIAAGGVKIIVGTHALVEESMRFNALALAVVDEQHRFGVRIRQLLTGKSGLSGLEPHLLSMTATPIPRSLALAAFGDVDLSVLKQKPIGRQPILTRLIAKKDRAAAYAKVRAEIAAGRQAFVVCPLIDPSDVLGIASVTDEIEKLRSGELAGIPLGMMHGKLSSAEKEKAMADFLEKRTMVLVSTSVVEVGVDVPNATVMCIEGAERFGLAQLHQFRGRVGRSGHGSFCYLLPTSMSPGVKTRLGAVVKYDDGFSLAEKDLEMRGPGDVLGTVQSGIPDFRMASFADAPLIADARAAADYILESDPDLKAHAGLRAELKIAAEQAHLE